MSFFVRCIVFLIVLSVPLLTTVQGVILFLYAVCSCWSVEGEAPGCAREGECVLLFCKKWIF